MALSTGCEVPPGELQIGLGARHEEGPHLLKASEAGEVEITPVEHVVRPGLGEQDIEAGDVGPRPVGDVDDLGDAPPQVEQRVQLDRPLVRPEAGPREERQAEIDGRRVEGVHRGRQVHPEGLGRVEGFGGADQPLGEVGVDPPVAPLVRIGQGAARDAASDAHVVQLGLHGPQTRLDVAQALAIGELGKGQTEKLVEAREAADLVLALVAGHAATELLQRQEVHDLREDGASGMHGALPPCECGPSVPGN